jgi:hypothetical protein
MLFHMTYLLDVDIPTVASYSNSMLIFLLMV